MRKIFIPVLLLALVAFVSVSKAQGITYTCAQIAQQSAPWYCSQINQAAAGIWENWAPVAIATIIAALMIAVMIFVAGVVLRNEKVRNFGIGEIYEAMATALIAAGFLFLMAVLFGLIPAQLATGPLNPYDTALSYVAKLIVTTQKVIVALVEPIMTDYFYSSISITVSGFTGSSVLNLIGSLIQQIFLFFIEPAKVVMLLLEDGMLALFFEFYAMLLFMYIGIPVFLIPGIILRAIFPLRPLGGMLMAIAISFYLIMPILFSIAYLFTNQSAAVANLNQAASQIAASGQGVNAEINAESPTAPLAEIVSSNGLLTGSMGAYFLSVLIYPAIIFAVCYSFMTVIADFIGGVKRATGRLALV